MQETNAQPLLTVIVPSYNSQDYLDRAMQSLVGYGTEVEVLIINDGSKDNTAALADEWMQRHPECVKAIHQENRGHGGALNAGIAAATGEFLKVVDSDDWLDRASVVAVLDQLRASRAADEHLDLLVTNYVYEKQGRARKMVVRYRSVLPQGRLLTWDDVKPCSYTQYFMMHSLILRTDLVRESGLKLPEHTFYVDFLYSFVPFPLIKNIRYLDVDLYRYFIGRNDQSVNEPVMISRIDQLIRVNAAMVDAMPMRADVHPNLYRYMIHYLRINCVVTSVMMLRSGTEEHLDAKDQLWDDLRENNPEASKAVRSDILGKAMNWRSKFGTSVTIGGYKIVQALIGFN